MAFIDHAASLTPSGRVRLIEVDGSEFSAGIMRFHYSPFPHTPGEIRAANGDETQLGPKPIYFGGLRYDFWPFQFTDMAMSTDQAAQPKLEVSNLDGVITALCLQFKDMRNAKVKVIDTFVEFLDARNFEEGNAAADPQAYSYQQFWVDRKTQETDETVAWDLSSPADFQGQMIPTRLITSVCEWALRGQYRTGDGCSYNGTAYFDVKGNPVSDPALDVCSGMLGHCRKRFGAGLPDPNSAQLDFGGFPATVLINR